MFLEGQPDMQSERVGSPRSRDAHRATVPNSLRVGKVWLSPQDDPFQGVRKPVVSFRARMPHDGAAPNATFRTLIDTRWGSLSGWPTRTQRFMGDRLPKPDSISALVDWWGGVVMLLAADSGCLFETLCATWRAGQIATMSVC
jgi:hypothetical protein